MSPHARAPLFRIAAALALFAAPWAGCESGADDDDSLSRVAGPTSEWPSRTPRDEDKEDSTGKDPASRPQSPATEKPTFPSTGSGDEGAGSDGPSKTPVPDPTPPSHEPPPSNSPAEPVGPTKPGPGMGGLGTVFDAGFATPRRDAGAPPAAADAGVGDSETDAGASDGGEGDGGDADVDSDAGVAEGRDDRRADETWPWWLPR